MSGVIGSEWPLKCEEETFNLINLLKGKYEEGNHIRAFRFKATYNIPAVVDLSGLLIDNK